MEESPDRMRGACGVLMALLLTGAAQAQESPSDASIAADGEGTSGVEQMQESLLAEFAGIESVTITGDAVEYDEAAGTGQWEGDVVLEAGETRLETDSLLLRFHADPETGEAVIDALEAGPEVTLEGPDDLVRIQGGRMTYNFTERTGLVEAPVIRVRIPAALIADARTAALRTEPYELTIRAESMATAGGDATIEQPRIHLTSESGFDIELVSKRLELLSREPDGLFLKVHTLKLRIDGVTLGYFPLTRAIRLRGVVPPGGFGIALPRPVTTDEGIGLETTLGYEFPEGLAPLTIGLHPEWVFADRMYLEGYLEYPSEEAGLWRLNYGTQRGESWFLQESIPVRREPELEWFTPEVPLTEDLRVRATLSYGDLAERPFGREAWRARAIVALEVDPLPLSRGQLWEGLLGAEARQSWYEGGFEYRELSGFAGVRYTVPGLYGAQVRYVIREDAGFSPFWHDRQEARREIDFAQRVMSESNWGAAWRGRYDLTNERWRSFDTGLSHRFDLLEVTLYYRWIQNGIGIEVGLPGLLRSKEG